MSQHISSETFGDHFDFEAARKVSGKKLENVRATKWITKLSWPVSLFRFLSAAQLEPYTFYNKYLKIV